MKPRFFIICCFVLMYIFPTQAQIYLTTNLDELVEVTELYKDYQNKITFNMFETPLNLTIKNAKITPVLGDLNSFLIEEITANEVVIEYENQYFNKNNDTIKEKKSKTLPVRPFPKSELCIGPARDGSKIATKDLNLKYCYPISTPKDLKINETITNWTITIPHTKESYTGKGNVLTPEAKKAIFKAKKNAKITLSTLSTKGETIAGNYFK